MAGARAARAQAVETVACSHLQQRAAHQHVVREQRRAWRRQGDMQVDGESSVRETGDETIETAKKHTTVVTMAGRMAWVASAGWLLMDLERAEPRLMRCIARTRRAVWWDETVG